MAKKEKDKPIKMPAGNNKIKITLAEFGKNLKQSGLETGNNDIFLKDSEFTKNANGEMSLKAFTHNIKEIEEMPDGKIKMQREKIDGTAIGQVVIIDPRKLIMMKALQEKREVENKKGKEEEIVR